MGIKKSEFTVTDKTTACGLVATYLSPLIPQNVECLLTNHSSFKAPCLWCWYSPQWQPLPSPCLRLCTARRRQSGGLPSQHEAQHPGEPRTALLPSRCPVNHFLTAAPAKSSLRGTPLGACLSTPLSCVLQHARFAGEGNLLALPMAPVLEHRFERTCGRRIWWGGQWCWGIVTWEDQEGKPQLTMKNSKAN